MHAHWSPARPLTLDEDELAARVGGERADILLHVRVLMIVDAHAAIARQRGHVRDERRLADRRLALEQDRVAPADAVMHKITVVAV